MAGSDTQPVATLPGASMYPNGHSRWQSDCLDDLGVARKCVPSYLPTGGRTCYYLCTGVSTPLSIATYCNLLQLIKKPTLCVGGSYSLASNIEIPPLATLAEFPDNPLGTKWRRLSFQLSLPDPFSQWAVAIRNVPGKIKRYFSNHGRGGFSCFAFAAIHA